MGLVRARSCRFFLIFLSTLTLEAAPKLRLESASLGPFSIAEKTNGTAQTVEAYNAGDGTLALQATSNVSWLSPSVGAARACTSRAGTCLPVQVQFQTSGLAKGVYTGFVTVADPNAVDAPQTVSVTAQIGGGVPDKVDLYVAPEGTAETRFTTNSTLSGQPGQTWVRLLLEGTGSFRFSFPYLIRVNAAGLAEGAYNGTIDVTNSSFAPDNKQIAVNMRVTSQPVAVATPDRLRVRLAQGAPKQTRYVVLSNSGMGGLTFSGGSVSASTPWLTLGTPVGLYAPVVLDPGSTSPGVYQGSVTLNTNAANGPLTIPVELEVVAQRAPLITYGGVVNNATFTAGAVAQGDLVAIFGEQFLMKDPVQAPKLPLTEDLGGMRVLVNGRAVPVYYVSYGQINAQMPYDIPAGPVEVRVERDGQAGNSVSGEVVERAPRLLRLGIGDYGIIVNQDYTFPIPATAGIASHPAHPGDTLTIYATGLGPTSPAAVAGAASASAEPLARVVPAPNVVFNTSFMVQASTVAPLYAGLTPGFVGLYQINATIPPDAPLGREVPLYLDFGNGVISNRVNVAIEALPQ
jgi:uncharacterized protein (TIGR03437 family)